MPNPNYYHEKQILSSGFNLIAGVDEVGRGTLAGPVVAGVVIIDINDNIEQELIKLGVNDSKALTAKKRTNLYNQLINITTDYSTGWASVKEIDKKNTDLESQFFSLNVEKIESVVVENNIIKISVKFISEQFKNNDENTITKKEDSWIFEKPTNSTEPNWLLSST